jgi:alpha-D-ribose 1-methylphosphonate 5-triphosphate synthase subunit PhnG
MTSETHALDSAPRRHWLAVLARASVPELEQGLCTLNFVPQPRYIRAAETGMVMLRARVGGTGDAFNLGEASVTRCALRLNDGPLGVGYTLGRNRRKAELIALFDALLQNPQHHATLHHTVIAPLAAQQAAQRESISRAAAASRVEFFTFVRGEA